MSTDINTAGKHFLQFAIAFLSLTKCQYQQANDVKVNSLGFFTLVALENWADENYTMSDLADKLRVYIRISRHGLEMMDELKQSMLKSTTAALSAYSEDELEELDHCLCRLTKLMEKFNADGC